MTIDNPEVALALVGYDHVSLTVTDLDRSARWYCQVLAFEEVERIDGRGFQRVRLRHPASGLALALTRHDDADGDPFDLRHTGVDHVALVVPDVAAVQAWLRHLSDLGVSYSTIGLDRADSTVAVVVVHDPDGIPLELFARTS